LDEGGIIPRSGRPGLPGTLTPSSRRGAQFRMKCCRMNIVRMPLQRLESRWFGKRRQRISSGTAG